MGMYGGLQRYHFGRNRGKVPHSLPWKLKSQTYKSKSQPYKVISQTYKSKSQPYKVISQG